MNRFIIPARRNSKGLPFKNRKLINYTVSSIPEELHRDIILSTDDEELIKLYNGKLNILKRRDSLAADAVSVKSVIEDVFQNYEFDPDDNIIVLYLTYPERTWKDIENAINEFEKSQSKSLLCRKEIEVSPYLYMVENGDMGKQLIQHDLYRRQDYPKCFEMSHFIIIFKKSELFKLNSQFWNDMTYFYKIGNVVDVDYAEDMRKINDD